MSLLPLASYINSTTPAFIPNSGIPELGEFFSTGKIAQNNYSSIVFASTLNKVPNSAYLALVNGQVQMSSINTLSSCAIRLSATDSNYFVNSPSTILTGTGTNFFYLTLPYNTKTSNAQLKLEIINLNSSGNAVATNGQIYTNSLVVPLFQNQGTRTFLQ